MGLRMTMGGRREEEHPQYTEGYNAGYTHALDEMRRRRTRAEQHMPYDDVHWPVEETRRMGYIDDRRGRRSRAEHDDEMLAMMHELKEGYEDLKRGMASAKKLDPHMEALLETATGVLESPPSTWEPYVKKRDYLGIAKMEGKELLAALEAHKPVKDIRKELSHTLAALMQLTIKQ